MDFIVNKKTVISFRDNIYLCLAAIVLFKKM